MVWWLAVGGQPDHRVVCLAIDDHELIGVDLHPGSDGPVRPLDAHLGFFGRAETEVDPPELIAGVASPESLSGSSRMSSQRRSANTSAADRRFAGPPAGAHR